MTELQAKWAAQHDWFLTSFESSADHWMVFVRDEQDYSRTAHFSNFQDLQDWAGY